MLYTDDALFLLSTDSYSFPPHRQLNRLPPHKHAPSGRWRKLAGAYSTNTTGNISILSSNDYFSWPTGPPRLSRRLPPNRYGGIGRWRKMAGAYKELNTAENRFFLNKGFSSFLPTPQHPRRFPPQIYGIAGKWRNLT